MNLRPQKPELCFSVGIVGHRLRKFPEESREETGRLLTRVMQAIEAGCRTHLEENRALYAGSAPVISLVGGMAEGVDQLAVDVRPDGWQVVALLPFSRRRYREDFAPESTGNGADLRPAFDAALSEPGTVLELPDDHRLHEGTTRAGDAVWNYVRLGRFLVRQIDMLVAVWDGQPAGGPGGTADIVAHALDDNVPVVWISPAGRQSPRLISTLADVEGDGVTEEVTKAAVQATVGTILSLPASRMSGEHSESRFAPPDQRLREFLGEDPPVSSRWVAYDWLRRGWRFWRWRSSIAHSDPDAVAAEWSDFLSAIPGSADLKTRLERVLLPRFAAADALASHFAHKYRSAYVLAYVLAVLTVGVALVGTLPFVPHEKEEALLFKAGLTLVELALVGAVIAIVGYGRRARWHDRWLDYRALAERLRHLRFLCLLGDNGATRVQTEGADAGTGWVSWYVRATAREIGLPGAVLDGAYQRAALEVTRVAEIEKQIAYNRSNAKALSHLHHRLHVLGDLCFLGTAAILVIFLVAIGFTLGVPSFVSGWERMASALGWPEDWRDPVDLLYGLKAWVTACAAFLPVLGAALAGIRFTGDFEGFAQRSAETAESLQALVQDYPKIVGAPDLDRSAEFLVMTARIMMEDLGGWRSLYSRKQLSLPS